MQPVTPLRSFLFCCLTSGVLFAWPLPGCGAMFEGLLLLSAIVYNVSLSQMLASRYR